MRPPTVAAIHTMSQSDTVAISIDEQHNQYGQYVTVRSRDGQWQCAVLPSGELATGGVPTDVCRALDRRGYDTLDT